MILVTVGTHNKPFNRLVIAADELAEQIDEQVVIQRGCSPVEPRYAEHFQFADSHRMEELTCQARVIVMHAAVGSIILAMKMEKSVVVVPRLAEYGEVIDNHQVQIARALSDQGRVVMVASPSGLALRSAVEQLKTPKRITEGADLLVNALSRQFHLWESREKA